MSSELAERVIRAVLYEGYVLYPYRPSSIKNRQRWNFGVLFPESWAAAQTGSDRSFFRMELLARADDAAEFDVTVRFLHIARRSQNGQSWEDADERVARKEKIRLGDLLTQLSTESFTFESSGTADRRQEGVEGEIELSAAQVLPGVFRLTAYVRNTSPVVASSREQALVRSLASASAVLSIRDGEFVSQTDPPPELKDAAAACQNEGVWPVLLGEEPARDTVLGTPVILPDYPQIAPESAGDLFDGTEIDEILTLRILTLSDAEKNEIRATDDRARQLLDRAESLSPEHLMRLHGRIRALDFGDTAGEPAWSEWDTFVSGTARQLPADTVRVHGFDLRKGDRVRLRPGNRADIIDIALAGKAAIIEAIERDYEDKVHLAVVLEDDPGRDLGELRQAGHRFFFSPSEVEPLL